MEKDAYYFPHFSNARSDRKLKRVIKELGVEGYGIYFMLLEVLRDQTDFKYPLDDLDLLADEFNTSEQKVRTVVANYKLFEVDDKHMFFSTKFNEFMQPYLTMKEQRRLAGIASGEARRKKALLIEETNDRSTDVQRMVNENEQSKVKERKEKKELTELETAIEEFKKHRKSMKSPMTDRAVTLFTNSLNKLASTDEGKIAIINQSIENGWKGVFPLKNGQVSIKPTDTVGEIKQRKVTL